MDADIATIQLSQKNIATTARTLAALDYLQGKKYVTVFEKRVKEAHPHCESDAAVMANAAVNNFTTTSMMGNGNGFKMILSAFVNGLLLMEMNESATVALHACSEQENVIKPNFPL